MLDGPSLWVARGTILVGLVFAGLYAWQAYTARRRADQIWYGGSGGERRAHVDRRDDGRAPI